MGINPNSGDRVETNYTIDGRHDAQNVVTEAEYTGNEAGKVFAQIAAQSDSANNGMSELSKRVAALESAPSPDLSGYATRGDLDSKQDALTTSSTSGTGWSATRWGNLVTLYLNGATDRFTLPKAFAPDSAVRAPLALGSTTVDGRFSISTAGAVSFYDAVAGAKYGIVTYLTA